MKTRNIPITYPRIQGEAFFTAFLMSDIIEHMDGFYVRDYVLDLLGHAQGICLYLPDYPWPTFGPGQRFLNMGGYVLAVVDGKPERADAEWILP